MQYPITVRPGYRIIPLRHASLSLQYRIGPYMSRLPQPLFDTFECFHELNFLQVNNERPAVQQYLKGFEDSCRD